MESETTATKTIYLAAYPTGRGSGAVQGSTFGGDVLGYAMAEDGTVVASHLSSSVGFSKHDLGLTSTWQHERYEKHYPEGYRLEWVDDPKTHVGWLAAFALNHARARQEEESESVGDVQGAR